MTLGGLTFLNPLLLAGLASLPLLWWLLRAVPPAPKTVEFPATELLRDLDDTERNAARTPWWLTLLRLLAAAAVIMALANPVLRPVTSGLSSQGPLLLILDTGWGSGPRWEQMTRSAANLLDEARTANRTVVLVETADPPSTTLSFGGVGDAQERLASLAPRPYAPDRMALLEPLRGLIGTQAQANATEGSLEIVWISDGLDYGKAPAFGEALAQLGGNAGPVIVGETSAVATLGLRVTQAPEPAANTPSPNRQEETGAQLAVEVLQATPTGQSGQLTAYDAQGRAVTKAPFEVPSGESAATAVLNLPLELANQVSRIAIDGQRSAGAVVLLDEDNRKRRVALLSSEGQGKDEPLLGSLFYARRALQPYVALTAPRVAELAGAIDRVATEQMTTILLADVGTLPGLAMEQLATWVSGGGVLIRFAGPRMEQARDDLLPAPLRFGGRRLGGALSWEEPRPLAAFEEDGLFAGMPLPTDVRVSRQVLADPAQLRADTLIWARLDDGTPLVTARRIGRGWIVLFHVTANADWSNLPLSGTFVAMLRRLVALAGSNVAQAAAEVDSAQRAEAALGSGLDAAVQQASGSGGETLAPRLVLDGFGALGQAPVTAKPIARTNARNAELPRPSRTHPPGYYGPANTQVALNLLDDDDTLVPASQVPPTGRAVSFLD
ncbi:MAG: BatA domain-containing protein, partial [Pseudomonadota bacterium]